VLQILPQLPEVIEVPSSPARAVRHVLGRRQLQAGNAVSLLQNIAGEVAQLQLGEGGSESALHQAASQGNLGVCMLLLQSEITLVHSRDEEGNTPMHLAARNNHLEVVRLLYQCGGLATAADNLNRSPMEVARVLAALPILEFLAREESEEASTGCRDLARAAAIGSVSCVRRLLHNGVGANTITALG